VEGAGSKRREKCMGGIHRPPLEEKSKGLTFERGAVPSNEENVRTALGKRGGGGVSFFRGGE